MMATRRGQNLAGPESQVSYMSLRREEEKGEGRRRAGGAEGSCVSGELLWGNTVFWTK